MATFEELAPKSQGKVLKEHPEFHTYPDERKAKIVKDRAKKDARNAGDVKRYNKETDTGVEATQRAMSAAAAVVAARKTKPSTDTVEEPAVQGKAKTELESLKSSPQGKYELSSENPFKIHEDNPLAKHAIDDNKDHADMMGQVGTRLEEHRLEHEGETDDVSDLGMHITRGFEALNAHDDAHFGGDVEEAKAKIKEAAGHFSTAASLAHKRYGDLPRVYPASLDATSDETRAKFAKPVGEWAIDIANAYVKRHANYAPQDKKPKGFGRGMGGRVLKAIAGVDEKDNPENFKPEGPGSGRKAEPTMAEAARQKRKAGLVIDSKDAPAPAPAPSKASRRKARESDRAYLHTAFLSDTADAKKASAARLAAQPEEKAPELPSNVKIVDRDGFTEQDHDQAFEAAHAHYWSTKEATVGNYNLYYKHDAFNRPAKYMATVQAKAEKKGEAAPAPKPAKRPKAGPVTVTQGQPRGGRGGSATAFAEGSGK